MAQTCQRMECGVTFFKRRGLTANRSRDAKRAPLFFTQNMARVCSPKISQTLSARAPCTERRLANRGAT